MAINVEHYDGHIAKPSIIVPAFFLVLFVIFIYGALFIGLISLSRWLIDAYKLTFFASMGNAGDYLLMLCILFGWFILAGISAGIPYCILRAKKRPMLASKVASVILFAFFHIFAFPLILWTSIRKISPTLSHRYRQKLKQMARGPIMAERKAERQMLQQRRQNKSARSA